MKAKKKLWVRIFFIAITIIFILGMFFVLSNAELDTSNYKIYKGQKSTKVEDMASTILGAINVVGIFVSVGMLMIIGVKYMMGSVEEKAEYKETMRPYLWGVILLFSGTTILNIIFKLVKTLREI